MKTRCSLTFLRTVLALCVLSSHECQSAAGRKKILKLDSSKSSGDTIEATHSFGSGSLLQTSSKTNPGSGSGSVSVSCSMSNVVVRVQPDFYGLGAGPDELVLGKSCKSNGVEAPNGELSFTYPLTECDVTQERIPGYLIYKFKLHYDPSPKRFLGKGHRIHVDISCHFPRNPQVRQLAVRPTWTPAALHRRLRERLSGFRVQLMDGSWSGPDRSHEYQLGQTLNFQASVPHVPTRGRLYVHSCYASPSTGPDSSLKHTIIHNFGCMVDNKNVPGGSWFVSRTDKLVRFSVRAFQFVADPENEVRIHCNLFVTSEDPSPAQKSCTFRENRWTALSGGDSVCECCNSKCVTSKPRRAMMEGSASSGSMLVSGLRPDDPLVVLRDGVDEDNRGTPGLKTGPELDGSVFRDKLFRDGSRLNDDSDVKRLDHQNQEEGEGVATLYSEGNRKHRGEEVEEKASPEEVEKASPGEVEKVSPEEVEKASPGEVEKASPEEVEKVSPEEVEKASPGEEEVEKASPEEVEKASPEEVEKASPGEVEKASPEEVTWYFRWR